MTWVAPIQPDTPIVFYGKVENSLRVPQHGYLSTQLADPGDDNIFDCPLPATPSSGGGNRIYPLHDNYCKGGDVFYQFVPREAHPGNRYGAHVVTWTDMANQYPDGDNFTNPEEVRNGTDPLEPEAEPVPPTVVTDVSSDGIRINGTLVGEPGLALQAQISTGMKTWIDSSSPVSISINTGTHGRGIVVPAGADRAFLRFVPVPWFQISTITDHA